MAQVEVGNDFRLEGGCYIKEATRDEGDRVLKVKTHYRTQTPYIRNRGETIGESLYRDHLAQERRSHLIKIY